MEDWALIRRLHLAEGESTRSIERLGISRTTAARAVRSEVPPKYERVPVASANKAVEPRIRVLLKGNPRIPATVIAERIHWSGSHAWLGENVARPRPEYASTPTTNQPSNAVPSRTLLPSGRFWQRRPMSCSWGYPEPVKPISPPGSGSGPPSWARGCFLPPQPSGSPGYRPFEQDDVNLFFQLVSARYEHASLILTSNRGFARWGRYSVTGRGSGHDRLDPPPRRSHHSQRIQLPPQGPPNRLITLDKNREYGRIVPFTGLTIHPTKRLTIRPELAPAAVLRTSASRLELNGGLECKDALLAAASGSFIGKSVPRSRDGRWQVDDGSIVSAHGWHRILDAGRIANH